MNTALTRKVSLGLAGIGMTLMSLAYTTGIAVAATSSATIEIPVSTVERNVGVGNSKVLETEYVADDSQNMVCSVKAIAKNQGSVHPGNNLVVASGSTSVTLVDVERASGVDTVANGELTLGETVTISLVMGEDDVFSAGMTVKLTCEHEEEIQVCRDGEIVTIPKSDRVETDSDTCKEIQVCRDGVIVTITEDQRRASDTDACPTPEQTQVCRDGEVITINKTDVLDTDLEGNCPQTLGTTTELPNTGASALVSGALALSTIASAGYGAIKSRK